MEAVFISLRECSLELLSGSAGITIPGFAEGLPPGVFVRGVPGGTLQQVIARLDVLHALKMSGILVYNDGRAIERTVDKAMTSWLLHRAGIPHLLLGYVSLGSMPCRFSNVRQWLAIH